jgi:hypothetical protein
VSAGALERLIIMHASIGQNLRKRGSSWKLTVNLNRSRAEVRTLSVTLRLFAHVAAIADRIAPTRMLS